MASVNAGSGGATGNPSSNPTSSRVVAAASLSSSVLLRSSRSRGSSLARPLFQFFVLQLLVLAVLVATSDANKGVYGGEYCDTEVFRAECSEGEVIIMQKAHYGRLKIGRCVEIDLGYIGCYTDVLLAADRRCSGKRVCEIRVPDAEFESTRPCLKELKTYLEANYQCVAVETVTTEYCKAHDQLNVTSSTQGYIASVVTSDTPYCDGSRHPWVIAGQPGQRINLTLYDFAVERPYQLHHARHGHGGGSGQRQQQQQQQQQQSAGIVQAEQPGTISSSGPVIVTDVCLQYALVEDSGRPVREKPTAICSNGQTRIQAVYMSLGNVIKVWVTAGAAPTDLKRFVVQYTVIGCADPDLAPNTWFKRSDDSRAVLGCHWTQESVTLQCVDNVWKGPFINCSEYRARKMSGKDDGFGSPPQPFGKQPDNEQTGSRVFTTRAISIGILIGIIAGIACIILIVLIVKLRRNRDPDVDGRQHPVLLRKHPNDVTAKHSASGNGNGSTVVDKRPLASNGSPASEPLMAAERGRQLANAAEEYTRYWRRPSTPNEAAPPFGDFTTCSTFKMTAADLSSNVVMRPDVNSSCAAAAVDVISLTRNHQA